MAVDEDNSYYALRVHEHSDASVWWTAARAASATAPPAIRAILAGRMRVEVTTEEAAVALAWASAVAGGAPLSLYPPLRDEL
jgi:hypothetical protein